jgi:PASTA domain
MSRRSLTERVLRIYPKNWRDRYGDEVRALMVEVTEKGEFSTLRLIAGLAVGAVTQRVRSWSWRPLAVSGSAAAFAATLIVVFSSPGPGHLSGALVGLTKGTMPSSTSGMVSTTKVPDFISAVGRNGKLVGYIPKGYLLPAQTNQAVNSKLGAVAPVYASNLKTLVGHFYPGVGFVPLGQSPASEPCTPVTTFEQSASGHTTTASIACPSTTETVPNIIGASTPSAMGQLSALSLSGNITYKHSRSVRSGEVVAVRPVPGTKLPARSVLNVVSSLGPSPSGSISPPGHTHANIVAVPSVTDQTQAGACATLTQSGFTCAAKVTSSESVGIGHVVSQMPTRGARVPFGSTISITVSNGP